MLKVLLPWIIYSQPILTAKYYPIGENLERLHSALKAKQRGDESGHREVIAHWGGKKYKRENPKHPAEERVDIVKFEKNPIGEWVPKSAQPEYSVYNEERDKESIRDVLDKHLSGATKGIADGMKKFLDEDLGRIMSSNLGLSFTSISEVPPTSVSPRKPEMKRIRRQRIARSTSKYADTSESASGRMILSGIPLDESHTKVFENSRLRIVDSSATETEDPQDMFDRVDKLDDNVVNDQEDGEHQRKSANKDDFATTDEEVTQDNEGQDRNVSPENWLEKFYTTSTIKSLSRQNVMEKRKHHQNINKKTEENHKMLTEILESESFIKDDDSLQNFDEESDNSEEDDIQQDSDIHIDTDQYIQSFDIDKSSQEDVFSSEFNRILEERVHSSPPSTDYNIINLLKVKLNNSLTDVLENSLYKIKKMKDMEENPDSVDIKDSLQVLSEETSTSSKEDDTSKNEYDIFYEEEDRIELTPFTFTNISFIPTTSTTTEKDIKYDLPPFKLEFDFPKLTSPSSYLYSPLPSTHVATQSPLKQSTESTTPAPWRTTVPSLRKSASTTIRPWTQSRGRTSPPTLMRSSTEQDYWRYATKRTSLPFWRASTQSTSSPHWSSSQWRQSPDRSSSYDNFGKHESPTVKPLQPFATDFFGSKEGRGSEDISHFPHPKFPQLSRVKEFLKSPSWTENGW